MTDEQRIAQAKDQDPPVKTGAPGTLSWVLDNGLTGGLILSALQQIDTLVAADRPWKDVMFVPQTQAEHTIIDAMSFLAGPLSYANAEQSTYPHSYALGAAEAIIASLLRELRKST